MEEDEVKIVRAQNLNDVHAVVAHPDLSTPTLTRHCGSVLPKVHIWSCLKLQMNVRTPVGRTYAHKILPLLFRHIINITPSPCRSVLRLADCDLKL